jgi:hypothetical protein
VESLVIELANLYVNDHSFQIYRIDGSKNEIPILYHQNHNLAGEDHNMNNNKNNNNKTIPLRIDGFPTFYLFSRENKHQPVEYLKDRNIETLHQFIEQKRALYKNNKHHQSVEENKEHRFNQFDNIEEEGEEEEEKERIQGTSNDEITQTDEQNSVQEEEEDDNQEESRSMDEEENEIAEQHSSVEQFHQSEL